MLISLISSLFREDQQYEPNLSAVRCSRSASRLASSADPEAETTRTDNSPATPSPVAAKADVRRVPASGPDAQDRCPNAGMPELLLVYPQGADTVSLLCRDPSLLFAV